MNETVILYRPVGKNELDLIEASGFTDFPPRLPEQPIFYPATNEAYAAQIALEWNEKYNADRLGYVTADGGSTIHRWLVCDSHDQRTDHRRR